jgi:hypothetical protein
LQADVLKTGYLRNAQKGTAPGISGSGGSFLPLYSSPS